MNVLVIGSGGREHALCWKLSLSNIVNKIYALPGNAGISSIAECIDGNVMDIKSIVDFAEKNSIDLTVVGPESPLIAGLADALIEKGLKVFGPNKEAAQMEGSKVFAKNLMLENNIPTAFCKSFSNSTDAKKYAEEVSSNSNDPIVVKADGEAAGKGVFICNTLEEAKSAIDQIMEEKIFGDSGNQLIIEEYLDGQEATFMCFVDGENFVPMIASQDYKRAYDNDEGPNTGGMGCYAPVPVFTDNIRKEVIETIIKPTLKALKNRGIYYRGVLYTGLALTDKGPKVIEFNCRFGDPETQVVLPLLESDFAKIALAVADGKLDEIEVNWYDKKALCVVMSSGGYPGKYEKGKVISGLEKAEESGCLIFHAGTCMKDNDILTNGGRVLGVTACGNDYKKCIDKVYTAVNYIKFDSLYYRRDIGAKLI
ncbi:MAG: phosphoribosylamine--glycine ligase [Armatimonadota bacterium]